MVCGDGFGFWGVGMRFGMPLFWGLVVVVIVALVRGFDSKSTGSEPQPRANTVLDILGERYARGEIDKAEFEQKRRDLQQICTTATKGQGS